MIYDPIVEEIQKNRKAHAKKYNNDLDKIVEALRIRENQSNRKIIDIGPKPVQKSEVS